MSNRYAALTAPLRLRDKTLKSRLLYPVAQPHFLQANETYPADPVVSYYASRAKNGAAILLMQDLTNLDQRKMPADCGHFAMYDIDDIGAQNGFTFMAEMVHYYGSYITPELNLDNRMPLQVNDPAVPSPYGEAPNPFAMVSKDDEDEVTAAPGVKPMEEGVSGAPGRPMAGARMMTRTDMDEYIRVHIAHAQQYKNLGFDGGLFDFSHNFNIGKFLNETSNWREDEYGGSFENRIRFPVEVIRAIREAMGENYLLVVNAPGIGESRGGHGMGLSLDEAAEFLKRIDPYIDLLQVRGMHPDHEKITVCESAELSKGLKDRGVKTPIAISTYYKDLDSLNNVIASGAADLVAPGHLFICNEHLGDILRDGNGEDLNPCIECHCCRGTSSVGDWMSHCTINPEIGMEHRAKRLIEPVTKQKKVALIGGGPGAIKCAMWLKDRGHTPVIFEQTNALGGQIKTAEYPEFKWELKRYLEFLRNQVVRKDIEVRLNTKATPEMISAEGFDVVVAATGATPKKPAIEGAETTDWNGINIYGQQEKLGKKVVVIGGSSVAAEAACYLQECGHEVVEISRQGRIAYDLNPIRSIGYMNQKADSLGVTVIKKAKTTKIEPGKVTYTDRKGNTCTVDCDDVVACGGMEPNSESAVAFRDSAKEFYMIGDCRQSGNMRNAIRDAYALAMRI